MDALKIITSRQSIRKYKKKEIPKDLIDTFLLAAMSSPSAMNEQPWHFIVIDDKNLLNEIPSFSQYAYMTKNAPAAILVCSNTSSKYWVQDCSAATQNMLLAIHSKGLGAVWTAVYPNKEKEKGFKNLLSIPKDITPLALIVIGYPDESPKKKDNFKKSKIHLNKW